MYHTLMDPDFSSCEIDCALAGDLARLARATCDTATLREFKRGNTILKPEERGSVYIIAKGRVKLYGVTTSGKKYIYSIVNPYGVFGDLGVGVASTLFAEAIDDVELTVLPTDDFGSLLTKEPRLLLALFRYYYMEWLAGQNRAASVATENILLRVVRLLVHLGKPRRRAPPGKMVTAEFREEELMEMLGTSKASMSRVLSLLQKRAFLVRRGKKCQFDRSELLSILSTPNCRFPYRSNRLNPL